MKIQIIKNIGNNKLVIDVDEREDKVALAKAAFFSEPDICYLCKSTDVYLQANKADVDGKAFMYIKRRCANKSCGATSTMGENTGAMGYFWKKWEIWTPKDQVAQPSSQSRPQGAVPPQANKRMQEEMREVFSEQPEMKKADQTVAAEEELEDLPF